VRPRRFSSQRSRAAGVLAALAAVTFAGCGSSIPESKPPAPPSAQDLELIRQRAKPPVFWLGSRYRGEAVTEASLLRSGTASFSYGKPSCSPGSGCIYSIELVTQLKRNPITDDEICWRRLGHAWLLGCAGYEEAEVLTGAVLVYVSATEPLRVARALKRMDASASSTAFTKPRRFTCEEARAFPRRFRARLPDALRPQCT
jgi:hypothetical protein